MADQIGKRYWQHHTNKGKVVYRSKRAKRYRTKKPFRFSDLVRVLRTVAASTDATLLLSTRQMIILFVEFEYLAMEIFETVNNYLLREDLDKSIPILVDLIRAEWKKRQEDPDASEK